MHFQPGRLYKGLYYPLGLESSFANPIFELQDLTNELLVFIIQIENRSTAK